MEPFQPKGKKISSWIAINPSVECNSIGSTTKFYRGKSNDRKTRVGSLVKQCKWSHVGGWGIAGGAMWVGQYEVGISV